MKSLLAVLLLCASAATAAGRGIAQKPEVADAISVLDAWIKATAASREQPGLSVGIVHDQELIWAKGYGFADLQKKIPATPETLYRIASISKLFTATAVLQLRDAGKLNLDDAVGRHLSWFKIRNVHGDGPAISVRQLLTHTSGLPREAMGVNWNDLKFPKREEMMRLLAEQETIHPAETEWKYSNLALSLAGEVVSAVSGAPWHQYVDKNILEPLRMTATRTLPRETEPGLARGYGRRVPGKSRDVEPFVDIEAERPAGNLASNVEDLAKFIALQLRANSNGDSRVLKASTLREMQRIQWLRPDWRSGWGLGFSIRRVNDQVRIGHGGSLPGQTTLIEFSPAEKLGVIVLTNANDGAPGRYVDQAFTLLTPAIKKAMGSGTPPTPDPAWHKFAGTYTWKHADLEVMVVNGELAMIFPEADNPWDTRMILKAVPGSANKFRLVAPSGSAGPGGEMVSFENDAGGRVTRLAGANWYYLRK